MHISPNRIVFYRFLIKYFFLQRVKSAKPTVDVYVLSKFWTYNSFSDFISNFFLLYENTEITSKNNNPALHLRRGYTYTANRIQIFFKCSFPLQE